MCFVLVGLFLLTVVVGGSFWMDSKVDPAGAAVMREADYAREKTFLALATKDPIVSHYAAIEVDKGLVPVLLYHSIADEPNGLHVTLNNFRQQMLYLKTAGYNTVSLEDFYWYMQGEKELPANSFLLTFDDGTKRSYYPVDPILKALDYRAVSFIITGRSTGEAYSSYYLTQAELADMARSGRWELGSHTDAGHTRILKDNWSDKGPFLTNRQWLEYWGRLETTDEFKRRIYGDLFTSRMKLQAIIGEPALGFAFPYGAYGAYENDTAELKDELLGSVRSLFPLAFYQVWGEEEIYNQSDLGQFMVRRINVEPDWDAEKLLKVLKTGKLK